MELLQQETLNKKVLPAHLGSCIDEVLTVCLKAILRPASQSLIDMRHTKANMLFVDIQEKCK